METQRFLIQSIFSNFNEFKEIDKEKTERLNSNELGDFTLKLSAILAFSQSKDKISKNYKWQKLPFGKIDQMKNLGITIVLPTQ